MSLHKALVLLALVGLLGTASSLGAQATTPSSFSAPDLIVAPATNFSITTVMDNSTAAVAGLSYSLCFDPTVLDLTNSTESSDVSALNGGQGPGFLATGDDVDHYYVAMVVDLFGVNSIPPGSSFGIFDSSYDVIGTAGDISPLEFCTAGNPPTGPVVVNAGTSASLVPTLNNGTITVGNAVGTFGFSFGPSPTMGNDFDIEVTLDNSEPVEGFRFGLAHDPLQVVPVGATPSIPLIALNGGAGPDLFLVDLNPSGGTGITIDCDFSTAGSAPLAPAFAPIVEVTYAALVIAGSCSTAEFEIRDDLGVPVEIDTASGPNPTSGANGAVTILSAPLSPPTGGVTLQVVSTVAMAGEVASVPVTLDTDVDVQGFALSAQHSSADYELLAIEPGVDLSTIDCGNGPDFFGVSIPGTGTDFGSVVAILDLDPAGPDEVLPAASDLEVARLVYQIPAMPSVGQITIDLVDGLGSPPLTLEVTSGFSAIAPTTISGTLGSGGNFIRGECNSDGMFNIADAINLLGTLFPSVPVLPITCQDACDANDDGGVNIADAVFMLDVLFGSSGAILPAPSSCGTDPTADSLDCMSNGAC